MTWLSNQNKNFPQGSPCKQKRTEDNDFANIEGEGMISRKELKEKGVEAFPSHPKNKLRNTKPGDWERREIYDELDWKHDHTVPKSFGEKAKGFYDKHKDKIKEGAKHALIPGYTGAKIIKKLLKKDESPVKQTAADSTFIRKNHPTYTDGYIMRTFNEMDERSKDLPKPTKQMESDHINANMIREKQAISRAKKTGIDVENMKASDGLSKLIKEIKK